MMKDLEMLRAVSRDNVLLQITIANIILGAPFDGAVLTHILLQDSEALCAMGGLGGLGLNRGRGLRLRLGFSWDKVFEKLFFLLRMEL